MAGSRTISSLQSAPATNAIAMARRLTSIERPRAPWRTARAYASRLSSAKVAMSDPVAFETHSVVHA